MLQEFINFFDRNDTPMVVNNCPDPIQKENFCIDIGSVEPIAPKLAIYHFIFLLVVSLLCIGVLPGILLLLFDKAEAMSAEARRKGLHFYK